MEFEPVVKALGRERFKVLHRLGHFVSVQFELDRPLVGVDRSDFHAKLLA